MLREEGKKEKQNLKKEEKILEKTEMRMLRTIKGVTLRDKVKRVVIRKELGVNSIQEKVSEMRLRWYGHMQRMEENKEVRAVGDMRVPRKRPRGKPRGRWMDGIRRDMHKLWIILEDAQDRTFWESRIRAADPTKWETTKKKMNCVKRDLERVGGEWRTTAKYKRGWRLVIENIVREK